MSFITVDDVRRASGAPDSLISDALVSEAITIVENEMARWMNTSFVPTVRIDIVNGNSLPRMFTMKNPLLSVRALTVNDSTSITPSKLDWEKHSGKIMLTHDSESSVFVNGNNNTFVKYLYGLLEDSSINTITSAEVFVGKNVTLPVASINGFSKDDWVEIYGMDGHKEVAQITTDPSGITLQVDELVKTHESGSIVVKLQIPYYIKRYMEIEAAIYIAVYAIGGTYSFNTSYSLGELSVNKGEPYPQWREVIQRMINERKMRRATIKIRPSIMVD